MTRIIEETEIEKFVLLLYCYSDLIDSLSVLGSDAELAKGMSSCHAIAQGLSSMADELSSAID